MAELASRAIIKAIAPGSRAAELGLEPGDCLLRINGVALSDGIDYLWLTAVSQLQLEVRKASGQQYHLELLKDPAESLGVLFDQVVFDGIRVCHNHCLFCFVHQMPAGQRDSLYLTDDDYRLSFLQGNYITLTNLTEADWQRIERLKLSPLYISVHATDPQIRQRLLGTPAAGAIREQLQRLVGAGITLHTQAVLCPGLNDGAVLEQTINDLAGLGPRLASLAVVPVGLTRFRENLHPLRSFTAIEARAVLETVHRCQRLFLKKLTTRFVFAADEWYILSGQPFPRDQEYEDYWQLDNGVGMVRRFLTEFQANLPLHDRHLKRRRGKLVVVTGMATQRLWEEIQTTWESRYPQLELRILPVANQFLGPSVTVTGLLGGADLSRAIGQAGLDDALYMIPELVLKPEAELCLDGLSRQTIQEGCRPKKVQFVPTAAAAWLEWLAG